ncbi:MAG: molybdopterin converting factor subunit 1 [Thermomicrobiales bacterium]|nr:molybdopterin converting factor subunit 1 [Thermomicrobiales bacterium]
MRVEMRYFAFVREQLGMSKETIELRDGSTVDQALELVLTRAPRLANARPALMMMVNQAYQPGTHVLTDGDEVAIIPPVSGGSEPKRFVVTEQVLDPRDAEALVSDEGSGALITFSGTVRDNARGKTVTALDYEAYPPAAEKMLEQIGDEIFDQWGIRTVAIFHRYGLLQIGEISVVIAVSAPHREAAFEACRWAIERIKVIVPIWKRELYEDGAVWIGSEAEYQAELGRSDPAGR